MNKNYSLLFLYKKSNYKFTYHLHNATPYKYNIKIQQYNFNTYSCFKSNIVRSINYIISKANLDSKPLLISETDKVTTLFISTKQVLPLLIIKVES